MAHPIHTALGQFEGFSAGFAVPFDLGKKFGVIDFISVLTDSRGTPGVLSAGTPPSPPESQPVNGNKDARTAMLKAFTNVRFMDGISLFARMSSAQ